METIAETGNPDAQYFLGVMFANGEGGPVDCKEAGGWFRASAEQGDVGAQYFLGVFLLEGKGMEQDGNRAGNWFQEAAIKDYPDAQFGLGTLFASGQGRPFNLILAYVWFKLAALNGLQSGEARSRVVEECLTVEELEQGQHIAQNFEFQIESR